MGCNQQAKKQKDYVLQYSLGRDVVVSDVFYPFVLPASATAKHEEFGG